jgi:hypothetical protein
MLQVLLLSWHYYEERKVKQRSSSLDFLAEKYHRSQVEP